MGKNRNNPTLSILLRIVFVILVAGFCILSVYSNSGTASGADETPAPEAAALPTPTASAEPTPSPTPSPEPEYFTITMIGDCTLASAQSQKALDYSYENMVGDDYTYPFAKTLDYFDDDDLTFTNLECALTESTDAANKAFLFKCSPEYANILKAGSVEFVTLGNNHVLDYGEQGYADTKAALDAAGIGYAGRDEWTLYTTKNGLKIGVYAISFGKVPQIEAGIAALKDAGAEFIIAALHWGDEGSYTVNDMQIRQGHAAIDAGADVVYGSHPHTLQKCEEYNGKYIYYSMGNWSFGGNTNPRDKDTVIVKLTVMRDVDGTV
ncbi:MAG: CapA family protein, partial [Oscillospiraceae bacterium]